MKKPVKNLAPGGLTQAFTNAWRGHAMATIARAYQADASDPGGLASAFAITTVAALGRCIGRISSFGARCH